MRRRTFLLAAATVPLTPALTGCGDDGGDTITIGYQSKTINTVTAGTLLRSLGYFERELRALGERDGRDYRVTWQDYATGAPITAQMVAGKIDIGSMGDFPLLINAYRSAELDAPTRFIAVTGYNLLGGLNTIVVAPGSTLTSVTDLRGSKVSSSEGSASDGLLTRALQQAGLDSREDIEKLNQEPAVGASALEAGDVAALSQFVAWPGLLAFQGRAQALYDGGLVDLPTFHGTVVREQFGEENPDVVRAFLRAQIDAGRYLDEHPLDASRRVAEGSGLPPEVVHLYNGPNGTATFDPTLKPQLIAAMKDDVTLMQDAELAGPVDVDAFVDDSYLRDAFGDGYARQLERTAEVVRTAEVWREGDQNTHSFPDAAAALRFAGQHQSAVRAVYVPDAVTGTRWFADRAAWVRDGDELLPFVGPAAARDWADSHPGSSVIDYEAALAVAGGDR